jgi:hypothetical protein
VPLDASQVAWIAAGLVYLTVLMLSHINIGLRFALPLYPLLYLIGVDLLWSVERSRWLLRRLAVPLLIVVQVVSAMSIAPQYLAYFTPVVGAARGWQFLVDSNVDWGQDLGRLKEALTQVKARRVLLAYFGTASPEAYGIVCDRWAPGTTSAPADYDVFAISVTLLQGVYVDDDPFHALRAIRPIARAGYSIFLYDFHDPAVRDALASSNSVAADPHEDGKHRHHDAGRIACVTRPCSAWTPQAAASAHSGPASKPQ